MNKPLWKPRISAKSNGDFINVKAYSGYRMSLMDPEAEEYFLAPNVLDEDLGKAIREALSQSRSLPIEEARTLNLQLDQYYKNWIEQMKARYGYKTKNALFKKMMNCSIELDNRFIIIEPSLHEKLEAWSGDGISPEDYVKIPADSPPEEIGAALRLAFKRCCGPKPDEYK